MSSPDSDPPGIVRVRADNPSPLTLDGTNSYVVDGWVVDPGPDDPCHLDALLSAAGGSLAGIVLTHSHPDHAEGASSLAALSGASVVLPTEGQQVGPFGVLATPGHAPDHVALLWGRCVFAGDLVLGEGSVFIGPGEGSLSAYLDSLRRLRSLELDVLCPGHGPYVRDVRGKIDEYLEHRLDRERRLVDALDRGLRSRDELLDAAWSEVPSNLRFAASLTMEAHLEKLEEEGRLRVGVERL